MHEVDLSFDRLVEDRENIVRHRYLQSRMTGVIRDHLTVERLQYRCFASQTAIETTDIELPTLFVSTFLD